MKDQNMYCEICDKIVYEADESYETEGTFIKGYVAIWDDTELGIISDVHNYSWLFEEFGIKIPSKGIGFCCEEHLKEWLKKKIKP